MVEWSSIAPLYVGEDPNKVHLQTDAGLGAYRDAIVAGVRACLPPAF